MMILLAEPRRRQRSMMMAGTSVTFAANLPRGVLSYLSFLSHPVSHALTGGASVLIEKFI